MKQLLFLLLLPCFAMAQYTGNANQKITLGEQTTADGLVYRGVASADTTRKPSIDTMAFILLDTTTNILWQYKKATNNAWTRLGGSISSGVTGVLPVANGGTNTSTAFKPGSVVFAGASGTYTQDTSELFWNNVTKSFGIGTGNPTRKLHLVNSTPGNVVATINNTITRSSGTSSYALELFSEGRTGSSYAFRAKNINESKIYFTIQTDSINMPNGDRTGFVGIGTGDPTQVLHVVGNARITSVAAGTFANNLNITSNGTLTTATSDEKYKYNILPLSYGLNTILQLKPVNFNWIDGEENDLGFIAQDVAEIIPEAVSTNWNSDLLFRYESIIPILTKAIQEQQTLIKALEQRILNLENK